MGFADITSLLLVLLLSMAAAATVTYFSIRLSQKLNVLAIPDARSSHRVPTPRLGGFGYFVPLTVVLAAILIKPLLFYIPAWGLEPSLKTFIRLAVICGSLAFLVGLMDDFLRLPPWFKLIGQLACAGLFVYVGSRIEHTVLRTDAFEFQGRLVQKSVATVVKGVGFPHVALTQGLTLDGAWANLVARMGKLAPYIPSLPIIATFLWIIILMNAYNFMDGIDGLAATFAVAVGLGLFVAYVPEVHQVMALRAHLCAIMAMAALLVGVSLGFLFYNRPPASVFLGDCGSQYVGFILAATLVQTTRVAQEPAVDELNNELSLALSHRAYVDFLAVVILVFPFLYDVTYTLLRRLLHGKAIWRAHHEHLYQRLIDRGWSHWRVILFSFPFYLANAAIFAGYCWAHRLPIKRIWPGGDTVFQHRWFWAALALVPMIIYTLVVIVVEKTKPAVVAPVQAPPEAAPVPPASETKETGNKPE